MPVYRPVDWWGFPALPATFMLQCVQEATRRRGGGGALIVGKFDEHELEVVWGFLATPPPLVHAISYLAVFLGCLLRYRLYSAPELCFIM
jgi:hypothetical protein